MRSYILLSILLLSFKLYAQKEASIWYFGRGIGIDFNTPIPTPLKDGAINTLEGSASICNKQGDLLFYTDGVTVWDRAHKAMPNGTTLKGHYSSTQSAIIIPKPGDESIYYIFTVDEGGYVNPPNDGLNYSEVNMCLNGGFGDVVASTKNTSLFKPTTEKVAAVKHSNGLDYWVVTHELGSNRFRSYLINERGVDTTAIISEIGSIHPKNVSYSTGQMKLSVDGSKLAVAMDENNYVGIFNFDTSTGKISNSIEFEDMPYFTIEFSPDATKLYTSRFQSFLDELRPYLYQYDLTAGTAEQIKKSRKVVFAVADLYMSPEEFTKYGEYYGYRGIRALQMGPDGKIYVLSYCASVHRQYEGYKLAVIEKPNELGKACNFIPILLNLSPIMHDQYTFFPTFVSSFMLSTPQIAYEKNCSNRSIQFSITNSVRSLPNDTIEAIEWDFGDLSSSSNHLNSDKTPMHEFSAWGTFTVKAKVQWKGGDIQSLSKTVTVTDDNFLGLPSDTILCRGQSLLLQIPQQMDLAQWQDDSKSKSYTVTKPGIYWAEICYNGCIIRDSIIVDYSSPPSFSLGNEIVVCDNRTVTLSAANKSDDTKYEQYIWQDGSTKPTFEVNKSGTYWVEVTTPCGFMRDTVDILYEDGPSVDLGEDITLCVGDTALVHAYSTRAKFYRWNTLSSSSDEIMVTNEGNYYVEVRNEQCIATDTIYVKFIECEDKLFVPNVITPNGDGSNDVFYIKGILSNKWFLDIYNKQGKNVYSSKGYKNDWQAENLNGGIFFYYLYDPKSNRNYKGWLHVLK